MKGAGFNYNHIIDIRAQHYFNGWPSQNLQGHFKHSLNIPYYWLQRDSKEIINLLQKHLTKNKDLLIVSEDEKESKEFQSFLKALGYKSTIHCGTSIETLKQKFQIVQMKNYQMLIYCEWIMEEIVKKGQLNSQYLIFHTGFDSYELYLKGHIPSAVYFDLKEIEDPITWNFYEDSKLIPVLERYGIDQQKRIILYGNNNISAFRLAVLLIHLGLKDVKVLDGGFYYWKLRDFPVQNTESLATPVKNFSSHTTQKDKIIVNNELTTTTTNLQIYNQQLIVPMSHVEQMLQSESSENMLIDIRMVPEYDGQISGYNYIEKKGRIKGAIYGGAGKNTNDLSDFWNHDKTMKNIEEIIYMWRIDLINQQKNICFYCGTGWRASEALFYILCLGHYNSATLYDGGWKEWSEKRSDIKLTQFPN